MPSRAAEDVPVEAAGAVRPAAVAERAAALLGPRVGRAPVRAQAVPLAAGPGIPPGLVAVRVPDLKRAHHRLTRPVRAEVLVAEQIPPDPWGVLVEDPGAPEMEIHPAHEAVQAAARDLILLVHGVDRAEVLVGIGILPGL